MKQKSDFDRIIREKLENIQPEFQAKHWDLFEQQLDTEDAGTPEAEEKAIDQSVYSKLHKMEVPYDPDSWKLLSQRIDKEFRFVQDQLRTRRQIFGFLLVFAFLGEGRGAHGGEDGDHQNHGEEHGSVGCTGRTKRHRQRRLPREAFGVANHDVETPSVVDESISIDVPSRRLRWWMAECRQLIEIS